MSKGADFSGWPKPKHEPVDISYQLRGLCADVLAHYGGRTIDNCVTISNKATAENAEDALKKAIDTTLGEQKASHLGIKVVSKEHRLDSYTAYYPDGNRIFLTDGSQATLSPEAAQKEKIAALIEQGVKDEKQISSLVANPSELAQQMLGKKLDAYFATDWAALDHERRKTDSKPFDLAPIFAREDVVIKHHTGVSYTVELEVPRGTTLSPVIAKRLFEKLNAYTEKLNGKPDDWRGRAELAQREEDWRLTVRGSDSIQTDPRTGKLSYADNSATRER